MRIFGGCFALILAFHLYAGVTGMDAWTGLSKPIIVGSLLAFVGVAAARYGSTKFSALVLSGLFLSLIGDVFLVFQEEDSIFFTAGLACFLLAHIAYTWAFSITYLSTHVIPLLKRQGWVMIIIVAYGLVFFNDLRPHLASMAPAVMLYTLAITAMLLIAMNRQGRVGSRSFIWIASGATIFVVSDSFLAWNKFVRPIEHSHLIIMGTYGLAQLGIAFGAVEQIRDGKIGNRAYI